ncbi:MAG: hypothetical protein KJ574_00070 [Nanoarchaeota archaeon]|nr:hypothetical protein [Nanoarchaeota archaeon]
MNQDIRNYPPESSGQSRAAIQTGIQTKADSDEFSSGIPEQNKKRFISLVLASILLFLSGGVIVFFTTKPYHLYFFAFMLFFSLMETTTFVKRVKSHLVFVEMWPSILSAFVIAFLIGLLVLSIEVGIMKAIAPISLLLFIICNIIIVFVSDFAHTLVAFEFVKKLLAVKVGEDFKENLLIAKAISPGKSAVLSGIRSIVSTLVILLLLAVLLTFGVTNTVLPKFDEFEGIPDESLQIQEMAVNGYVDSLQSVNDMRREHEEWNRKTIAERQNVSEERSKITGNLVSDTWLLLQGGLFSTVADAQQFAAGINTRFYSAQLDFQAIQNGLKYATTTQRTGSFSVPADRMTKLSQEIESQYSVFAENKDEKFSLKLPIESVQTELGTLNIKDLLPDIENRSTSLVERLYTQLFETTSFYQDALQVMDSLQATKNFEKERIEMLYQARDTQETEQSRYIWQNIIFRHLLNFNIDYCKSLGQNATVSPAIPECFKKGKLINKEFCNFIEDDAAYSICVT